MKNIAYKLADEMLNEVAHQFVIPLVSVSGLGELGCSCQIKGSDLVRWIATVKKLMASLGVRVEDLHSKSLVHFLTCDNPEQLEPGDRCWGSHIIVKRIVDASLRKDVNQ